MQAIWKSHSDLGHSFRGGSRPAAAPASAGRHLARHRLGKKRLTDRDVIQMVESGQAEATIVATIRSSRTNFDLSPQGCKLLTASHVSRTILIAMAAPANSHALRFRTRLGRKNK